MNRPNPCVFLVGCPRSGTTLLQRMLDHHPQLAVANDTHFIPKVLENVVPHLIEEIAGGADVALTSSIVEGTRTYHRFRRLGLSDAAVDEAAAGSRTYGQFVSALYDELARCRGKAASGEKTPDYVRHLPVLHGLFPWARVVHIVRDGRDVGLSTLEWAREKKGPGRFELWNEEPVAVCALWWSWQVGAGLRDGAALGPDRYREVRYEALVSNPEETLHELAAFLDLPFASQMLTYYEGKTRSEPGLSAKAAWLPPTVGLRDWRTQMAERDVALFDALAGDVIAGLGYERGSSGTSAEVASVAERCRAWWNREMASRSVKLARAMDASAAKARET